MKYFWTDQTFLSATGVVATMHQELQMAPGGGGKWASPNFQVHKVQLTNQQ